MSTEAHTDIDATQEEILRLKRKLHDAHKNLENINREAEIIEHQAYLAQEACYQLAAEINALECL